MPAQVKLGQRALGGGIAGLAQAVLAVVAEAPVRGVRGGRGGAVFAGGVDQARDAVAGVVAELAIGVTERVVLDAPVGIETSFVAEAVRIRPLGPGLGLAEREGLDLAHDRDAVDRDREDPAIGAVGIADDGAARQGRGIDPAGAVVVVVRGLDQGRRAIAEALAAREDATVAVVAEAQDTGAIAEADQATARAFPADQWIVGSGEAAVSASRLGTIVTEKTLAKSLLKKGPIWPWRIGPYSMVGVNVNGHSKFRSCITNLRRVDSTL